MKTLILSAVGLLALVATAQAADRDSDLNMSTGSRVSNISGGKLGDICTSKSAAQLEACNAYLEGVSDSIAFYQHLMPSSGEKGKLPEYVCVPKSATGSQLRDKYVSWLRQHSEAQRQLAVQATLRALNDSYKCPGES